ncbi:lipase [Thalassomonas viridans]|uniref:Lipase n=1 Tax=Thalassomonas viridans TaxID=137584 RepID=A0AAF0CA53_9GAMM|nr:lipase [Thalassomonas viridans]
MEYDDQGTARSPARRTQLLDHYLELAARRDVLLLTFVHGWHHSAKPQDTNISKFRQLLEQVSASESRDSAAQKRQPRAVLGVFIGWRGDSIDLEYINTVTFWDRKNTAHEVGRQGVTQALLKLEELVNVRNFIDENSPASTSRLVVIGHSFGGAVVYSALQKVLTDRFVDSRGNKNYQSVAGGFGDLVLLMNPAFEALRFAPLFHLSQQECRRYLPEQLPKLAVLTSETDYATKIAFPLGRSLSTFFESHRKMTRHYCTRPGSTGISEVTISQGSADRTAIGHFEPYMTHTLSAKAPENQKADFDLLKAYQYWSAADNTRPGVFSTVNITSLQRTTAHNPYMNIKVDKQLMNGHNDIWGRDIVQFVSELIRMSTTPKAVYEQMQK